MRWEALFDDLEGQAAALEAAERAAEVDERTRIEVGGVTLADRLRGSLDRSLVLRLADGTTCRGDLLRVGAQWLLLADGTGRETLVVQRHVTVVRGAGRDATPAAAGGPVESRLSVRHVLRGIGRDRSGVRVGLSGGEHLDGTIDRVAADFVELAAHAAGEPRRHGAVREIDLVPLAAIATVARSG
jgi:hypothetical protein